jgi:4'-phosphopantetheinyl transferase EntD
MEQSRGPLRRCLPHAVEVVEKFGIPGDETALPEERLALGAASAGRRREFGAGRACARMALAALGRPAVAILRGAQREPVWPRDVAGSITHCAGYCAAAVADSASVASLGIDAEPDEPLPAGILQRISRPEERGPLEVLPRGGACWDRLLFCAKESVFKAWFPLFRCWLGFEDARVAFDATRSAFVASILRSRVGGSGEVRLRMRGRFGRERGILVAAVVVPARPQAEWKAGLPAHEEGPVRWQ